MRLQSDKGYKPLHDLQIDQKRRLVRENVTDATFRFLFVGTDLSDLKIVDIDQVVCCPECHHCVIFFETTCEAGTKKNCWITATLAAYLDKFVAPTIAFVVQIHDFEDHDEYYIPKWLTVYPIYIPRKFRHPDIPPARHLTYEQFQQRMQKTFKVLHPPEVCAEVKAKSMLLSEGIVKTVDLTVVWEGNNDND
jgi:hypothetical protein